MPTEAENVQRLDDIRRAIASQTVMDDWTKNLLKKWIEKLITTHEGQVDQLSTKIVHITTGKAMLPSDYNLIGEAVGITKGVMVGKICAMAEEFGVDSELVKKYKNDMQIGE